MQPLAEVIAELQKTIRDKVLCCSDHFWLLVRTSGIWFGLSTVLLYPLGGVAVPFNSVLLDAMSFVMQIFVSSLLAADAYAAWRAHRTLEAAKRRQAGGAACRKRQGRSPTYGTAAPTAAAYAASRCSNSSTALALAPALGAQAAQPLKRSESGTPAAQSHRTVASLAPLLLFAKTQLICACKM